MKIVGVDPGKTSGIVIVEDGDIVEEYTAKTLHDLYLILSAALRDASVLVVERFIYGFRYRGRNMEDPIKSIGICEMIADEMGVKLALSNPSALQKEKGPSGEARHTWSAGVHAMKYYRDVVEGRKR